MNKRDLYDFLHGGVQIDLSGTTPEDWANLVYQFEEMEHNINADAMNYMKIVHDIPESYDIEVDGRRFMFVRAVNYFKENGWYPYLSCAPNLHDICMFKRPVGIKRIVPFTSDANKITYELELGF